MFGTLSTRKKAWVIAVLTCLALLSLDALATERPALPAKPTGSEQAPDAVAFYHFMLGYQRELYDDAGEAEAEYLKALARDPNSVAIHLRLATLYQAQGEHDKAQAHAEAALARDATNRQALHMLASVAVAAGRADQAIELYQRIVALWPQETQAYSSMAMLLSGLKRYDEAEQTIRRGIAVSQTAAPTGYLYLGHILVEQKAWARAVQAYRDAVAINPGLEPAHLGLPATLVAKRDTAQAIAVLRKVLQEVNKGNREARQRLVRLLLTQKAYEAALGLLREAIQESPDDVDAQLRIGLIYGELKDYVKAVEQIKRVLALRPQELRVRDHLAYLYEEMKEFDKAIAEYRTIIQADARYSDAHLHLGYLLYRLKRNDEALPHFQQVIEEMKRAVAVVPDDPVFLEHLGEIYLSQRLLGDAREAWLRSLELDPTNHKLAERFKAKGFGDPATEERIRKSQGGLSNKALSSGSNLGPTR